MTCRLTSVRSKRAPREVPLPAVDSQRGAIEMSWQGESTLCTRWIVSAAQGAISKKLRHPAPKMAS